MIVKKVSIREARTRELGNPVSKAYPQIRIKAMGRAIVLFDVYLNLFRMRKWMSPYKMLRCIPLSARR